MIDDFRTAQDGTVVSCDLCIIGAGAAGISIALEFAGTSVSVCLLESGGLDFDPQIQKLYEGEAIGLPYPGTDVTRLRYFGGTTNHWSGRCAPLDEIDLAARPWISNSGWPISRPALDPYYDRAHPVCGLARNLYSDDLVQALELAPPSFDRDRLRNHIWQFRTTPGLGHAPLRFGEAYREELAAAPNIQVLLYANVTSIHANKPATAIEHVDIATLAGTKGRVTARQVVLAGGGIENARLLLASTSVEPSGLGNRHDLVGRFFMEHHTGFAGNLIALDSRPLQENYNYHQNTSYRFGLGLGPGSQERERSGNCAAVLHYIPDPDSGIAALRHIWTDVKAGGLPDDLGREVWRVIADLDDAAAAAAARLFAGRTPIEEPRDIEVELFAEQVPNRDSRVLLSGERDALGLPKTQLDWRLQDVDRHTMAAMMKVLAEEFGRLKLGRIRLADWLSTPESSWTEQVVESSHHMGTTRMADDPRHGVVDGDCRVHGIANLYIAGSSVFPTGGHVNPTLTIVALALRLADHLHTVLDAG